MTRSGFGRVLLLGLLLRVAPGAASGKCFVARSKGLAGTAGEMHAGMANRTSNKVSISITILIAIDT